MKSKNKSALVVEGGGMRGIFAAGVLDSFLYASYNPFDLFIGVSAGATVLASYLSGQYQRYYRLSIGPMINDEFVNFRRFLRGGHFMDLDWLWNYASVHDPLDMEAATQNPAHEYLVGVTDVRTAEPIYLKPRADTLSDYLLASSALPVLYRKFIHMDGHLLTDGGIADPIPVREAYRLGAKRIVVIRSRPSGCVKDSSFDSILATIFLHRYPALRAKIKNSTNEYRSILEFIKNPPAGVELYEIAPQRELLGKRLSMDNAAVKANYELGRRAGIGFVSQFKT